MNQPNISKRMRIMLISVGILFGCIFIYKVFVGLMIKRSLANQSQIVTVSAAKVAYSSWKPKMAASASLRAIQGVNVTTELAGMVQTIYFTPGAMVKQNALLVQLNADAEIGQLQSLQANQELARITYERDKAQFAVHAVSKQQLDSDFQNLKSLQGQVKQQAAIVAKKSIRAPFSGRLGINNVNLGQYLNTGDTVVMLQQLDPIYADFYVPQQSLPALKADQPVMITSDSLPGKAYFGKITTINPGVDPATRNVEVEATIANHNFKLAPGMFATVDVTIGSPKNILTIPQTAVAFNPYGEIVYIVRETEKDKNGKYILTAHQTFVTTGEIRGDQIAVLKGLKEGDMIVTSGQLKLKNGMQVAINNKVVPPDNPAPKLPNDH